MFVVTGATGRTGRAVVGELLRSGRAVRALGRGARGLAPLRTAGARTTVVEPTDRAALTEAFRDAEGAYVMVQPNYIPDSPDFSAHQRRIVDAMAGALADAGVGRVVTLSSWGADKESGTGPVAGLHYLEERTNGLDAAVTNLRAGYFMENLLGQAASIRAAGVVTAPFDPDLAMPFIAAEDIGRAAAHHLAGSTLARPGRPEVLELHGERDLSMAEATEIIAEVTGRPELRYVRQSIDQFAAGQRAAGVSRNVTDLMVEVAEAINSGHTATRQPRSAVTTTPTTMRAFLTEALLPMLRSTQETGGVVWR
ncbi:NmrA family NAD(P)-binding protein [Pseudonocardia spinosispora]|uniref:NmrA family NAD(P)-binding protein n=1 Tax=Pseudonocardia spinosispora TaxID=103441 RepID=UPI0004208403|nr:NmrA family NAD(P)-binding protein [Pseudonocardia spinosispora]